MKKQDLILLGIFFLAFGFLSLKAREIFALPELYKKLEKYREYILGAGELIGVPPALIAAVIWQESKGNPYAVSRTGAIGLMQIQPSSARYFCGLKNKNQLFDPKFNILCGTEILRRLYEKTGSWSYAVAKYYGGPDATPYSTWGKPPVKNYVRMVLSHYEKLKYYFA